MAKLLKLRRGTTTQHSSFTGAEGEVTVDTDKETLVVHDGSTAGGHPVAAEDLANVSSSTIAGRLSNDSISTSKIAAGTLPSDVKINSANINDNQIVNADIYSAAAIAGTKISPNFGSQAIITSGNTSVGETLTITGNDPNITFVDSNNNPDYKIFANAGEFTIYDETSSAARIKVNTDGHIDINANADFSSGVDVTGAITATGNISMGEQLTISATTPNILFTDTNNNPDYRVKVDSGDFTIEDAGDNSDKFVINSDGHIDILGNLDVGAGIDVTGNISVSGTVDGRDVASDGSKLDGIESGATADQTSTEIKSLLASDNLTAAHLAANSVGSSELADNAVDTAAIATDAVTSAKIADDQINSEHYVDGSIDTAHIANDQVTFAKVQNISTARILGNVSGSTGDVQQLSASNVRSMINVEDGATADQTASEIVSLIASQTIAPTTVNATNLNSTDLYATGKIGRDSNDYITWTNNSRADIYVNGNNEFRFESDGDFHADGDVIAFSTTVSSDKKLKENIEVVPNALEKVQALDGVTFTWKRDGTPSAGVIAQEVQAVLPEAVKEVTPVKGGDSHLSVNYHALTSILIESIKELKAEIEQLKGGQ